MFDFFDDMFCEASKNFFRYQVDSGSQIVVEGYKTILLISAEKIVLKLGGGELAICGINLQVKEFCAGTIKIVGKICSVENSYLGDDNAK
jgi:hypothetical protein